MAREGYEDYLRHRQDAIQNSKIITKLSFEDNKQKDDIEWRYICVGDMIIVEKDQDFPADVVILASSNPDGTAFINTSSLDGEKNLKPKVTIYYLRLN